MTEVRLKLEDSWKSRVGSWFDRPEMHALREFLQAEKQAGKVIFPPSRRILRRWIPRHLSRSR